MPAGSKNLRQRVFFSEQEGGRLDTRVNHKPPVRNAAGQDGWFTLDRDNRWQDLAG